jgi:16S rRNA (guanine527-N7)-methyltransferase
MKHDEPRAPLTLVEVPPLEPTAAFTAALDELGLSISHQAQRQLGAFLAFLLAMNERVNLTAITQPEQAWLRHGLDALTLLPQLATLREGASVLDVGSGGGVPGIPLAIARPDLAFTLLEATKKKAAFLSSVSHRLALSNITVVAERAEAMAPRLARRFDVVTARAVAPLDVLLAWTAPFAKPGGKLLFIKGERAERELAEAQKSIARFKLTHDATTLTPTGRIIAFTVHP